MRYLSGGGKQVVDEVVSLGQVHNSDDRLDNGERGWTGEKLASEGSGGLIV